MSAVSSPAVRLRLLLAPAVVEALEDLIAERVRAELAGAQESDTPWLSLAEAADYLGVSTRTLERMIERRKLRTSTVGRRRLIHRHDLDRLATGGGGDSANRSTPPARGVG